MIFQEGSHYLIEEFFVLHIGEGLEEAGDVLCDGKLEPPLFVIEAALDQRHQVLNCVLFPYHFIQLHDLLHDADPYQLVLVLQHGRQDRNT